jgi:uncharacterized protein YbaP (TraB family)
MEQERSARMKSSTISRASLALLTSVALIAMPALAAPPKSAAKQAKRAAGLIYKLESTSATVYVLGSIHVADSGLYPLDKRIDQAFEQADTLVLETELTPTAKARGAKLMQQAGLYVPPDQLDKHLDPALRAALDAALSERGIPAQAVQVMRPWLVSLTLTLTQLGALGYKPELGIDEHFRGRGNKKQMAFIESVEQQVAVFRDLPEDTQLAALRQTLEQLPQLGTHLREAIDAWKRGDAAALDAQLLAPMRKEFPKLYERLFVSRNKRMAEAVAGYLEGNGTVFVVVGSGHLVGPNSVLTFLKQRGHVATQL